MKRTILELILIVSVWIVFVTSPVVADTEFSVPHAGGDITLDDNGIVAGGSWDNPKWFGIVKDVDFGTEVSKEVLTNPFDGDNRRWVDGNDGVRIMAKVTTHWCFWRCDL